MPYPFRELDILEINDWGFGVAPAGVIYITKEAFNNATTARATAGDEDEAFLNAATSRGINERFAHEVAHGFFPHIVQLASNQDGWLSESIADYVSATCIQRTSPNAKEGQRRFDLALREWKNGAGTLKPGASIFLASELAFEDVADGMDRQNLLYAKGPLVLHAIRREFARMKGGAEQGDPHFFSFLRALVRNFTFKPIETRMLPAILRQMTETDWQPFFEKYVYGTEMPPARLTGKGPGRSSSFAGVPTHQRSLPPDLQDSGAGIRPIPAGCRDRAPQPREGSGGDSQAELSGAVLRERAVGW